MIIKELQHAHRRRHGAALPVPFYYEVREVRRTALIDTLATFPTTVREAGARPA